MDAENAIEARIKIHIVKAHNILVIIEIFNTEKKRGSIFIQN